jgi:hypothetical protein
MYFIRQIVPAMIIAGTYAAPANNIGQQDAINATASDEAVVMGPWVSLSECLGFEKPRKTGM